MADRKLYVNINNEQDLITLLGSNLIPEFAARGIVLEGLLLSHADDPELRELLARHGLGLRHSAYYRNQACAAVDGIIIRLRNLRFFALSPRGSTLHAKSLVRYRDGEFSLGRYWCRRILGQLFRPIGFAWPLLAHLYAASMRGLPALDAPILCLDYIHNGFHQELLAMNRTLGKPYIAYVANLDQVTNYPVHFDIPDSIFVWGAFHESILTGRFGIPAHKVVRIGFCRSDSLVNIAPSRARPINTVYFCASIFSNDPDYETNLRMLIGALEATGPGYRLTLKKHPGNETDIWEHYQRVVASMGPLRGQVALVGNTWEKYSKLESRKLADKDFSYADLRSLLSEATHVLSSTSTTTLEAALAGCRSYFINVGRKLDGTFAFEHLRALVDSGVIRMLTREDEFGEIFRETASVGFGKNQVIENVGSGSRAFAERAANLLFPETDLTEAVDSIRLSGSSEPATGSARG